MSEATLPFSTYTNRIGPQAGFQTRALANPAQIVILGGAAGCGKTSVSIIGAARHKDVPGAGATIFRRNETHIKVQGGLWDEAKRVYPLLGGVPHESKPLHWFWPHNPGFRVAMSHLAQENTVEDWQGSQLPLIIFDELTHFLASQFWYMVSRNRTTCGVEPRMMATCNPDVDSWVADLIAWWIDQEPTLPNGSRNPRYGYFIPERAGKIRFFGREGDRIVWGNSRKEVIAQIPRLGRGNPRDMVKSLTFIPGVLSDNAILEAANPQYRGNLEGMIEVQRLRLLGGNWKVRAAAGDYFREEDFEVLPDIPNDVVMWARRWDLAATKPSDSNPDPDWTYGVLMGRRENGHYVIGDAKPLRDRSEKVRKLIKDTAEEDGQHVYVGIPQDPGQAGVDQVDDYVADLAGFNVWVDRETGDKETRVEPLATQSQRGHVSVVRGRWNAQFFGQMVAFPSKNAHDDAPDAAAGAFQKVKSGVTMFEAA